MTCGNPTRHKIKNLFGNWLDNLSIETKLTDNQLEFFNSVFVTILQNKLRRFLFSLLVKFLFYKIFTQLLVQDKGDSFLTNGPLAPPHPIRRSSKPISKIIIFRIKMIFSF